MFEANSRLKMMHDCFEIIERIKNQIVIKRHPSIAIQVLK